MNNHNSTNLLSVFQSTASRNGHKKHRSEKMPIGRRGLIVPQNTFLEDVIQRSDGMHENFIVGSAEISDYPVVYCNSGFAQMTGFKRSEVMKLSCDGKFLLGSFAKKEVLERIRDALRCKTSCQEEFIGRKKDGSPVWYLFHLAPIENEENVVVLFLVTVRDISEFKEPISENEGAAQKWVKLKKTLKNERNAFVVAFSKTKEEKNKIRIAQLMVQNSDFIPQYKQQIPKPPKWVILHYSFLKIVWDWFVLLFILYTASAVPFVICFNYDSVSMIAVDCLVDLFFFLDIILNFHTSYIGLDGEVITELKQIRQNYIRTWFFPDLITSLPYGLLSFVGSSNTLFVYLISFFKCIRLLRVNRVIRKLDTIINYGFITLMLCLVAFLLIAHVIACVFYLIADKYDHFNEVGWVATMAKETKQPFNISNAEEPVLPTLASRYVSSLYYCLTSLTTIGFGNISPNTTAEKIFGCITMIVGALGYAVIFGQVTAIMQQAQKQSEKYHALLENIKSFQKLYKVPAELSARILDYFMSTWALTKGVDTDEVLKQCPKDLQSDICIHLNRKVLYNNSAFSSMPMSVMRTIASNFCICHVAPGDRVVHEGENLDVLYFVSHGSFEVKQDGRVAGLLGQGDVFGDDICNEITVGKSIADVYALTYSDIHCIDRNDLREVLMSYPEAGVEFSRNLKLTFNLRNQMTKKDSRVENKQSSFQLPNRTTRLTHPTARGRRLSLVQELNQSVDFASCMTADPNFNYINMESIDSAATKRSTRRRPERTSTGVISEAEEIDLFPDSQDVPDIIQAGGEIREEAGLPHFDQGKSAIQHAVSRLKVEFGNDINELDSKLKRIESQISLVLHLLQAGSRPELKPRHTQSFPASTPTTTQRHRSAASSTNHNPSPDEASTSSAKSPAGNFLASEDSDRKTSTPLHDGDNGNDDSSPQPLARFGRRKVNSTETK